MGVLHRSREIPVWSHDGDEYRRGFDNGHTRKVAQSEHGSRWLRILPRFSQALAVGLTESCHRVLFIYEVYRIYDVLDVLMSKEKNIVLGFQLESSSSRKRSKPLRYDDLT